MIILKHGKSLLTGALIAVVLVSVGCGDDYASGSPSTNSSVPVNSSSTPVTATSTPIQTSSTSPSTTSTTISVIGSTTTTVAKKSPKSTTSLPAVVSVPSPTIPSVETANTLVAVTTVAPVATTVAPVATTTTSTVPTIPAELSLSPTSKSFELTDHVSRSVSHQFVVTNTGGGSLRVTDVSFVSTEDGYNNPFEVTVSTCQGVALTSGQSCSLEVTLDGTPEMIGTYARTARMTVTTDTAGSFNVNLTAFFT